MRSYWVSVESRFATFKPWLRPSANALSNCLRNDRRGAKAVDTAFDRWLMQPARFALQWAIAGGVADIIRQWTNVHGLSESPSHEEFSQGHTRRVWKDANGKPVVELFSISGMAHGVPLATTAKESCGSASAFFLDVGISSTHRIARFWRLHESLVEMPRPAAPVSAAVQLPTDRGTLVIAGPAAEGVHSAAEASFAEREEWQARYALDPDIVIAAAFKAAGLPVPEIPTAPPGTSPRVAPGPIIAAALKAAGLVQS